MRWHFIFGNGAQIRTLIWLSACHIPGIKTVVADKESRDFNDSTQWSLNSEVFATIMEM